MAGDTYSTHLPSNLAAGDYLVRHEIIGLHRATTKGLAEFYPACGQLRVGGTGTGVPKPENLVGMQDLYKADDPGILVDVRTRVHI